MDMDEKCSEGLLVGRPFGGVGVFIRKNLCHFVKFCSSDQEGRVICVKVTGSNLNLLLFGCYLPCNDHSSNYLDNLSRIF